MNLGKNIEGLCRGAGGESCEIQPGSDPPSPFAIVLSLPTQNVHYREVRLQKPRSGSLLCKLLEMNSALLCSSLAAFQWRLVRKDLLAGVAGSLSHSMTLCGIPEPPTPCFPAGSPLLVPLLSFFFAQSKLWLITVLQAIKMDTSLRIFLPPHTHSASVLWNVPEVLGTTPKASLSFNN